MAKNKDNIIQLILFCLGDEYFAVNIDQIKEIVLTGEITPIPDSPDFINGITNIRGKIATVINLEKKLHLTKKETVSLGRHIIITEQANTLYGLLVDEVTEILRIKETEIKTTPKILNQIDRGYIKGFLSIDNRLIMLLDLQIVLLKTGAL